MPIYLRKPLGLNGIRLNVFFKIGDNLNIEVKNEKKSLC
jgi:hypothetical protein